MPCRHVLYCWRRGLYVELMQRRVRRRLLLGIWRLFAVRRNHDRSGAVHALQCRHLRSAVVGELFRVSGRVLLSLRHGHDRSLHSVSAGVLLPLRHWHVLVVHRVPGRNVLHHGRRWLSIERMRRHVCSRYFCAPRRLCRCCRHKWSGAVHALRCGHVREPVVRELLGVPNRLVLESEHWHIFGLHGLPGRNVLHYWCRGLCIKRMRWPMCRRHLLFPRRLRRCLRLNRPNNMHTLQCGHLRSAVVGELFRVSGRVLLPLRHGHDRSLHSVPAGVLLPLRHWRVLVVHRVPGRNVLRHWRRGLPVKRLRRRVCSRFLCAPWRLCSCRRHERSGAVHALRCGHVRDPVVRELHALPGHDVC